MPMANVASVLAHGILSYERVARLPHHSVALPPVQDLRDKKHVPGGLKLHQYANLYFHARNPMLHKRLNEADTLCVLRVSTQVLSAVGTVITDQNAASAYVRFLSPAQWQLLDWDDIFAMDWRHPGDRIAYWRHKSRKCAEVLVPQRVGPQFISGVHVVDAAAGARLAQQGCTVPININPVLFFR